MEKWRQRESEEGREGRGSERRNIDGRWREKERGTEEDGSMRNGKGGRTGGNTEEEETK